MNTDEFCAEASEALGGDDAARTAFIEKWVPLICESIAALRQEKLLLELQANAEGAEWNE